MKIYKLPNDIKTKQTLKNLNVDSGGLAILNDKMHFHLIKIESLHVAAANILKQDALSIGADIASPKGVITCEHKYVDVILMGTTKHLKHLSKKELAQPFGLKAVALELKKFLKNHEHELEVMGVINANDDSFFSQSRFQSSHAVDKIYEMIDDGAKIIDIGGVSSRPGSNAVSTTQELSRVQPIIDTIKHEKLYDKVRFSIDSYKPEVISYALESGFDIVNDITGLEDDTVADIVAAHNAQVVIMHMQGTPQTMQAKPHYDNIITDIDDFFQQRVEKALDRGVKRITLDVGFGFGKILEHNLTLLQHLEHFGHFGYPLLVGASRKSMIDHILPTPVEERLPATLALHLKAVDLGASIIRCHDVKEHVQALSIHQALEGLSVR